MQVSEVMSKSIVFADISDSIKKVAELMRDHDIGSIPVCDNGKPCGFVTDRDIVISCVADGNSLEQPISEAMNSEFVTIEHDEDVTEAVSLMGAKKISRLVVVEEEKPVGIVSLQDLSLNINSPDIKSEILTEIKQ